tara:strand:+ start:2670 stop:2915 length:246 start_codon:yes stop_codon:yes gene_type:complete
MEATIYYFDNGGLQNRTMCFPFRTEATLKKHLTSIYGSDNMDNVFWDIWEPEEEEGLEEIETDPDTEVGKYLKKKVRKKKT